MLAAALHGWALVIISRVDLHLGSSCGVGHGGRTSPQRCPSLLHVDAGSCMIIPASFESEQHSAVSPASWGLSHFSEQEQGAAPRKIQGKGRFRQIERRSSSEMGRASPQ